MASRLSIRRTSWCLLIAFLFAVLAPTAKAIGAGDASQVVWAHLCTAEGGKLVALDQNGDPATEPDGDGLHAGHCLLCFHPCGIPSSAVAILAADLPPPRFHALGAESACESRVWKTPPCRAPPLSA
ncbi:DUF2946 family protein [Parapusillimonas granuli]|uniref:DUF2946 family protein n=1 Tax=Parapusillimonas granuli TaxID=380911 RepID=UPI001FE2CB01|nr:DUF2946 family protein [Parapusillimonas granuli]